MTTLVIARNTAREAIRNKVLYSTLFFALLIVGVSSVLGAASIGDKGKYIRDFSLFSISFFGVVTTVLLGVNLLHNELGRKTIFNILSKAVHRWQFLLGKYFGLLGTLALLVGIMTGGLLAFLRAIEGRTDWGLLWAAVAILLELAVLLSVALFFSAIVVTPALAGLFTAATFVAGRSVGYLDYFLQPDRAPVLRALASILAAVLPHLDRFWIADRLVYHDAFSLAYFGFLGLYALAYATLALGVSIGLLHRREFS